MMKTDTTNRSLCVFMAHYCATLLGAGATCIRLTKNVDRIARAYGKRVEITIMPRHVHLSVLDPADGEIVTIVEPVPPSPISFNVNTGLSLLSWQVADDGLPLEEAKRRFDAIVGSDRQSRWLVLFLAAAANSSFCRLFGGDLIAMGVVFVATAAGYYLKQELLKNHIDVRVIFMICSFLSAVIAASDGLFGLGSTPQIAMGTSVLYLVPGIPFLNSFSDMLYRHYICAFSRFVDALILTCCLSIGLCAGMSLMHIGMF